MNRRQFMVSSGVVMGALATKGMVKPADDSFTAPLITGKFKKDKQHCDDSLCFHSDGAEDRVAWLEKTIARTDGNTDPIEITIRRNGRTYYWPDHRAMTFDLKDETGHVVRWAS